MTTNPFQTPFMLGFGELEDMFLNIAKGAESFPPYNIEQLSGNTLRITLAVAGYSNADLEITAEEEQLVIRGKQETDPTKTYLHKGIAARSFIKSFVLARGLKVTEAVLENGLLHIDIYKPEQSKKIQKITIRSPKKTLHHVTMQEDNHA